MKTIFQIFSLVIILFFSTCKKYGDGYVKGTVEEKGTGQKIPDATIKLIHWIKNPKPNEPENEIIQIATTNNIGEYKINFHMKIGNRYSVECYHKDYISENNQYDLKFKKTALNFSLNSPGFLKLRIKKNTNSLNNIHIEIRTYSIDLNINHPFDTILPKIYNVYANINNQLYWFSYPIQSYSYDNIIVNKGDTITHLIQYN